MLIKRLAAVAVSALLMLAPALAEALPTATMAVTTIAPASPDRLTVGSPIHGLAHSVLPADLRSFAGAQAETAAVHTEFANAAAENFNADGADADGDLGRTLIALAMKMRDIRYVRGGHDPSTGFDCSGFVRYVFAHAIGLELPGNSAAQFLAGLKVKRTDMQPGDLVFFHTHGRRHVVSHVGIYIDNGRFIHSPSAGKSVEVSSLDEAYWAKRFIGARRPEGIAQNG